MELKNLISEMKIKEKAVNSGVLSENRLNDAAQRFLNFVFSKKTEKGGYDRQVQHEVARRVASNGICLLKNENGVLPLSEEKTVKLSLPASDLAYYNPALKEWVVEPGDYKLFIAASSQDIRLELDYSYNDEAPYTINQISEGMIG